MILQTLTELREDMRQGLRVHLAMNKVTDFTPMELYNRWKLQYGNKKVKRLTFDEFMQKKKAMLHRFMTMAANG